MPDEYQPPQRGNPEGMVPGGTRAIEEILLAREPQLSTRDKKLREALRYEPQGRATADMATDLTPSNIGELMDEIRRTRDPQKLAILQQELQRLRDAAGNLLGPVQPPVMPGSQDQIQRPVFNPVERPVVRGGMRLPKQRYGY